MPWYHVLRRQMGKQNSEDQDQATPVGAVWSRPASFVQTFLSEN